MKTYRNLFADIISWDNLLLAGFRVFPYHRYVNKENAHRAERFIRKKVRLRRMQRLSPDQLEAGLNSWLGHVRFGHSRRLEDRVFRHAWEQGVNVCRHPRGSWRVLEFKPFGKQMESLFL